MTKSDQAKKRAMNRNMILRALHFSGPMQRSEISRFCDIRKSSVTDIVAELLGSGLLRPETPWKARSALGLDKTLWHAVVANITRGEVQLAKVYLDGRLEEVVQRPLEGDASPLHVIEVVGAGLNGMIRGGAEHILGAGVAVAGLVDHGSGRVIRSAALGGWRNVEIGAELERLISLPVLVENDVRCQAWSGAWFDRLLKDYENILYLGIFEGVACAMIMHGLRVYGSRFAAGEIGHVRVGDQGRLCKCGKIDCLEAYCSIPAIKEEIIELWPEAGNRLADASDIAAAHGRSQIVENVLDRVTQQMAKALAGLVAAIDPQVLVVGTGDRRFSEIIQPLLQRHLYTELVGMGAQDAEIMIAAAVDAATLKGMAGLVMERYFQSE